MAADRSASPPGGHRGTTAFGPDAQGAGPDERGSDQPRGRSVRAWPPGLLVAGLLLLVTLVALAAMGLSGSVPAAPPAGPPTTAVASSPSAPPHPAAATTGVPAGTRLTPSAPIVVTVAGTVIEGLDVVGSITVEADDVTIRDTRIRGTGGPLVLYQGTGLLVEDSELDGRGGGNPAIGYHDYTLRRVDVHDVAEGPRIAGNNVTIEDSYIHDMVQVGANHTDAVQVTAGAHIVVRHNTLQVDNPATGSLGNAAFQFGEEQGPMSDCLVADNYLDGGNYTVNGGGGGTRGAACTFRGNTFGGDSRYGPVAHLGPSVVWDASNVWASTGRPVR